MGTTTNLVEYSKIQHSTYNYLTYNYLGSYFNILKLVNHA